MDQNHGVLCFEKLAVAEPRHEFTYGAVYRTPVPGGWLVVMFWASQMSGGPSITFMPDPDHAWDGHSLKPA